MEKLLTFEEATNILRISPASLYRIINSEKIAVHDIGGLKFSEADIEAYIKSRRKPVNPIYNQPQYKKKGR